MKQKPSPILAVLAVLMCQVLVVSQCFALSGGPEYPGAGVRTVGTYAGVLNGALSNSIGIFSVKIASEGLGTGTFLVVRQGIFYRGPMDAVADIDTGKLTAILQGKYEVIDLALIIFDGSTGQPITGGGFVTRTYLAAGRIEGDIGRIRTRRTLGSIRIEGTASVSFSYIDSNGTGDPGTGTPPPAPPPPEFVLYQVVGFKQSET